MPSKSPTLKQAHERVNQVLARLGWLEAHRWDLPKELQENPETLANHIFSVGEMDDAFYVQVNPLPKLHPLLVGICVYAMRYRLCSGWHGVYLHAAAKKLLDEADAAAIWLAHERFAEPASRKLYRNEHPECAGWSWRRIREEAGHPYGQSTCLTRRQKLL